MAAVLPVRYGYAFNGIYHPPAGAAERPSICIECDAALLRMLKKMLRAVAWGFQVRKHYLPSLPASKRATSSAGHIRRRLGIFTGRIPM